MVTDRHPASTKSKSSTDSQRKYTARHSLSPPPSMLAIRPGTLQAGSLMRDTNQCARGGGHYDSWCWTALIEPERRANLLKLEL
jgi:hypothetical protein